MAASNRHQQKRHGRHQKHTHKFLKVYSPYLPLMMIVVIGLVLSVMSPPRNSKSVLAYATSMSVDQLLASTNQYRASNGLPPLKINTKLSTAAQNKANDMVSRDYWSHVTPDGQQPWVFITNAGYKYQAAAENLAYGFSTSAATVQGWMNSPDHRVNMLNSNYVDVGFAYKNSPDFVNTGQETVVVAEYGKPISVAAAPATTKLTSISPAVTQPEVQASKTAAPTTNQTTVPAPVTEDKTAAPVAQTASAKELPTQSVSRFSSITGARSAWISTVVATIVMLSVVALVVRHTWAINKWLRKGEKYVLNHFVFDLTIISLVGLCVIANQSIGFIK